MIRSRLEVGAEHLGYVVAAIEAQGDHKGQLLAWRGGEMHRQIHAGAAVGGAVAGQWG